MHAALPEGEPIPEPLDATPDAFDPDVPTEAVGSLKLLDIDAIRLPRLGWLFVAGAIFVGLVRLGAIGGMGDVPGAASVARLAQAIETGTIALLPAALLLRAPAAPRTHRLLLAGLATGAVAEIGRAAVTYQPLFHPDALYIWGGPLDPALEAIAVIGLVLTGFGLLRLWPGARARSSLLAVIVGVYLALTYLPVMIAAASGIDVSVDVASATLPAAYVLGSALVTWVAVAAWLDRADSRAFWTLLSAALPIRILIQLVGVATSIRTLADDPSGPWFLYLPVTGTLAAATACLALLAYVRYTPVADADPDPDRRVAEPLRRLSRR